MFLVKVTFSYTEKNDTMITDTMVRMEGGALHRVTVTFLL